MSTGAAFAASPGDEHGRALRRVGGIRIAYGALGWVLHCLFMLCVAIAFVAGPSSSPALPATQWIGFAFLGPVLSAGLAAGLLTRGLVAFEAGARGIGRADPSGTKSSVAEGPRAGIRAAAILFGVYAILAAFTFLFLLWLLPGRSPTSSSVVLVVILLMWVTSSLVLLAAAALFHQSFGGLLQRMTGIPSRVEGGIVAYAFLNLLGALLVAGAVFIASSGGPPLFVIFSVGAALAFVAAPAVGSASFLWLFLRTPLRPRATAAEVLV